jgi:hypothetical protein
MINNPRVIEILEDCLIEHYAVGAPLSRPVKYTCTRITHKPTGKQVRSEHGRSLEINQELAIVAITLWLDHDLKLSKYGSYLIEYNDE